MIYSIIINNDIAYKVLRMMPKSSLSKKGIILEKAVEEWLGWLGADQVLVSDKDIMFCSVIKCVPDENLKLLN